MAGTIELAQSVAAESTIPLPDAPIICATRSLNVLKNSSLPLLSSVTRKRKRS